MITPTGWLWVNGTNAKSCVRDACYPAPTIHFGARLNKVVWRRA